MTEFAQTLRHRCRHKLCGSKLPVPVANLREAFCKRGCYNSFYLHRCRVCEGRIEQKGGQQRLVCKKARCRNAWQAKSGFGRYVASSDAIIAKEAPISCGLASASKPIPWRLVAGPKITANQYHCATVPDGPHCCWEGGSYGRIESANKTALASSGEEARKYCAASDGVRSDWVPCSPRNPIPDDLSIHDFLRSRLDWGYSDVEDGRLPEHFRDAEGAS